MPYFVGVAATAYAAGSCKSCSSATTCQVCTHNMYLNPITQRLGSFLILMLLPSTVYIVYIGTLYRLISNCPPVSHRLARCTNDCPSDHYMEGRSLQVLPTELRSMRWQWMHRVLTDGESFCFGKFGNLRLQRGGEREKLKDCSILFLSICFPILPPIFTVVCFSFSLGVQQVQLPVSCRSMCCPLPRWLLWSWS